MILVLRFIGVMNAAIWFGSAVFVLLTAPSFFSEAVQSTPLGKFWPGVMVQFLFARFFHLQCMCGAIAVIHQLAEWVYLGRMLQKWLLGLLGAIILFGLVDGLIIAPKCRSLNLIRYGLTDKYVPGRYTSEERLRASESFAGWHRASVIGSMTAMLGLAVVFWKVVHSGDGARFISANKFRR